MTEELQKVQDRATEGLETVQTQVLEMNKRMAKALSKIVPESASLPTLPFAGSLPHPTKVFERGMDVASKVIEANKAFALNLAEAWRPEKNEAGQADIEAEEKADKPVTADKPKAKKPAKK